MSPSLAPLRCRCRKAFHRGGYPRHWGHPRCRYFRCCRRRLSHCCGHPVGCIHCLERHHNRYLRHRQDLHLGVETCSMELTVNTNFVAGAAAVLALTVDVLIDEAVQSLSSPSQVVSVVSNTLTIGHDHWLSMHCGSARPHTPFCLQVPAGGMFQEACTVEV